MWRTINKITVENVSDLSSYLDVLPEDMPVRGALESRLTLTIIEDTNTGDKHLEVA